MKIIIKLSEALDRLGADTWDQLCEELELSPWCLNEGFPDADVELTEEQAIRFGFMPPKPEESP